MAMPGVNTMQSGSKDARATAVEPPKKAKVTEVIDLDESTD
jgi:hypothetical protein